MVIVIDSTNFQGLSQMGTYLLFTINCNYLYLNTFEYVNYLKDL